MFKLMNSKKGFTLVELMIVVVIMAILVAVAVPIYNAVTTNAKKKTCAANCKIISEQMNQLMMGVLTNDEPVTALTAGTITSSTVNLGTFRTVTTDASLVSILQGNKMPECPFGDEQGNSDINYAVSATGEVTCANTAGGHV